MNGGSITGNYTAGIGGGIAFESGSGCVALESGTIENNYMNAALTPDQDAGTCSATGGILNDIGVTSAGSANISTHLAIKDSAVIGSPKIYFDKYKFFVENPANGVKLGNAAGACETAVTTALSEQNLTSVVGSLWYQTIQDTLPLTVYVLTHCTNYNSTKDLYAAVIETDASGVPVQNASVKLEVVEPDESGICHLVLPGNNEHGYAVVFMQEGKQEAQIVKVTPADITVYTGGAGYTGTVGGSDTAIEGLPEPGFYVTTTRSSSLPPTTAPTSSPATGTAISTATTTISAPATTAPSTCPWSSPAAPTKAAWRWRSWSPLRACPRPFWP